jgi:predicted dehydrogenase
MRIGVIGAGNISGVYLDNLSRWPETQVVTIADSDLAKAEAAAEKSGIEALTVDKTLARADIDVVLNLTVPKAHFEVSRNVLMSGKSLYSEKPLALSACEGDELMSLARDQGLKVGCAPDTVLGAGTQTARALIEEGAIGAVVGLQGFMLCPGHESWHPSPAFYYERGGGPLWDMGPYYLTAMIHLAGPIAEVASMASTPRLTRTITSQPLAGTVVPVETPTHIGLQMLFANGVIGYLSTSFDVVAHSLPYIEVYGTQATLSVPDPNGFGGPVKICRSGGTWEEVPLRSSDTNNLRGLGLRDWAKTGTPRASGDLALHVVEIMEAALQSSEEHRYVSIRTSPQIPPVRVD